MTEERGAGATILSRRGADGVAGARRAEARRGAGERAASCCATRAPGYGGRVGLMPEARGA
ncbi:hypothetical protein DRV84_08100 [Rhodosalinus sediminis]|uniref:Uncharacterized protein n=1 Tax=Rhodosalinus sediminis TaxID=1940533 RepID=A0A3D9BUH8_9RHOB|nr:hypothetical protein [Rhodosalinus sediminis]REC57046.1 hypothetical protein DRV84_08100 [Rhodosalinus sediminis]